MVGFESVFVCGLLAEHPHNTISAANISRFMYYLKETRGDPSRARSMQRCRNRIESIPNTRALPRALGACVVLSWVTFPPAPSRGVRAEVQSQGLCRRSSGIA